MIALEKAWPKIRARLDNLADQHHAYMVPRDLMYLRSRRSAKGDKSVSLFSATLGSRARHQAGAVLQSRRNRAGGEDPRFRHGGAQAVRVRVRTRAQGLMAPTLCMSYGGELEEMRLLPGYNSLIDVCARTASKCSRA
jgi:hypothetical protein